MASFSNSRRRRVVPRWRLFDRGVTPAEREPHLRGQPRSGAGAGSLEPLVNEWRQSGSLGHAADLVNSAVALELPEVAAGAARSIIEDGSLPAPLLRQAASVLGDAPDERPDDGLQRGDRLIRVLRARLIAGPVDPLGWMDLALAYSTRGHTRKAERAISVALGLAGEHRLVLRGAARFFVHEDEEDRALRLLRRAANARTDPWILAAQIAIADLVEKSPIFVKEARALLDSGNIPDAHKSELASAMGTLELGAGAGRIGRRLIRASLVDPTENSLAQAAWLHNEVGGAIEMDAAPRVIGAYEARTLRASHEGEWATGVGAAGDWLDDEPFSAAPAVTGSHMAIVGLGSYEKALSFTDRALIANRESFPLRNNRAFALAHLGRLDEAHGELKRIPVADLEQRELVYLAATTGFIRFRAGDAEQGRHLYAQAEQLARRIGAAGEVASALTFLALEEARSGDLQAAIKARDRAFAAWAPFRAMRRADVELLIARLKRIHTDGA